jgi:Cu-Zn family superoxide dismutase
MKQLLTLAFVLAAACGGSKPKTDTSGAGSATGSAEATPTDTGSAGSAATAPVAAEPPAPPEKTATAKLAAASKSKVTGTITFKQVADGLEVTANVEGLTPGDHAWHIHEKGDCSAPDATSAGGHFNPENHKHGAPDATEHHAGDLGNLTAGKDGKATKTFTMKGISLDKDNASIVGKGFIVHEKVDDFKTQPTGNAGARVACGVIELDQK